MQWFTSWADYGVCPRCHHVHRPDQSCVPSPAAVDVPVSKCQLEADRAEEAAIDRYRRGRSQ